MTGEPVIVPDIQTERMTLRQLTEDDMDFIFDMFSRPETNQYVADDDVKNMEEAVELYEAFIKPKPYLFRLGMVLEENGQLIGTLGFYSISMDDKRAVLGADLFKEHWGQGLMQEAVQALLRYGFEEMELNRIEASVDPDNIRSMKLTERSGFVKEGVKRQLDWYKGAYHDDVVFSMLREEWQARK